MSEDTIIYLYAHDEQRTATVLINVLIRSILTNKVLQGSVSSRLRCDGIFNDQFITQSLLSAKVKNLKICQHLPKLWAIK